MGEEQLNYGAGVFTDRYTREEGTEEGDLHELTTDSQILPLVEQNPCYSTSNLSLWRSQYRVNCISGFRGTGAFNTGPAGIRQDTLRMRDGLYGSQQTDYLTRD